MIELSELQYFRTVANLEHVTKAAQELHISQPNLSNAISRLETKLGVKLFERRHGKISLTSIGQEYLQYVNEAFSVLEAGEQRIQELTGRAQRQIRVCCSVNSLLNPATEMFLEAHPDVPIHQDLSTTDDIVLLLEGNEIDFAVTMRPVANPKLEWQPVFRSELMVGVSAHHPWANYSSVPLSMLKDEPIICNNVGADRTILETLCKQAGFQPRISFESNDGQYIGARLQKDNMLTLIPTLDLYTVEQFGTVRPVHPIHLNDCDAYVTVGILKRKDRKLSCIAQEFMEFCRKYLLNKSEEIDMYMEKKERQHS